VISPYNGLSVEAWNVRTRQLIVEHPLDMNELYEVVNQVWTDIFESGIGKKPFKIGVDLFPRPQVMAFFLHELIPLEFARRYPGNWRREETSNEKDMVYIPDAKYSIEIKTSSSPKNIYGNRSYAQEVAKTKKEKSGYYLAINFEGFKSSSKKIIAKPIITTIRFGWLDHADWQGQSSSSGQQARLHPDVERYKLLKLPFKDDC